MSDPVVNEFKTDEGVTVTRLSGIDVGYDEGIILNAVLGKGHAGFIPWDDVDRFCKIIVNWAGLKKNGTLAEVLKSGKGYPE